MSTIGADDGGEESQAGSAPFLVTLNDPPEDDTFTSVYPTKEPPEGCISGLFTSGLGVEVMRGGSVGAGVVGTPLVFGAAVAGLLISTHPPSSTDPLGATNRSIQVLFESGTHQEKSKQSAQLGVCLNKNTLHAEKSTKTHQVRLPSTLPLFGGHGLHPALPSVDLKVPAAHWIQLPGSPV